MEVKVTGNFGYVLYRVCKRGFSIIGIFRYKRDCIAFQRNLTVGTTMYSRITTFRVYYQSVDELRII